MIEQALAECTGQQIESRGATRPLADAALRPSSEISALLSDVDAQGHLRRQDRARSGRRARLDEPPAEAALDAEIAQRDVVVERRRGLHDLRHPARGAQRAADAAVRADRVGRRLPRLVPLAAHAQVEFAASPSARRWDTPRCSCRSRRTRSPAAAPRTRSRCARRSRARPPRWRTCSGDPCRTPRRTCSRARTWRSRGCRDRCRSSPAARRWRRTSTFGRRVMAGDRASRAALAGAGGPYRSGSHSYSSSSSAMPGAVDRSTDDASSSSTILREWTTRGDRVCTTMPASTAREQLGASTRAPSTSTTHSRHTFTGRSVSR